MKTRTQTGTIDAIRYDPLSLQLRGESISPTTARAPSSRGSKSSLTWRGKRRSSGIRKVSDAASSVKSPRTRGRRSRTSRWPSGAEDARPLRGLDEQEFNSGDHLRRWLRKGSEGIRIPPVELSDEMKRQRWWPSVKMGQSEETPMR